MNMTIEFTSTTTDYELFTDPNVVLFMKDRWGLTTDSEVSDIVAKGLEGSIDVFFSLSEISFNNMKYQKPLFDTVYESGIRDDIKSLRIKDSGITGTILLKI